MIRSNQVLKAATQLEVKLREVLEQHDLTWKDAHVVLDALSVVADSASGFITDRRDLSEAYRNLYQDRGKNRME